MILARRTGPAPAWFDGGGDDAVPADPRGVRIGTVIGEESRKHQFLLTLTVKPERDFLNLETLIRMYIIQQAAGWSDAQILARLRQDPWVWEVAEARLPGRTQERVRYSKFLLSEGNILKAQQALTGVNLKEPVWGGALSQVKPVLGGIPDWRARGINADEFISLARRYKRLNADGFFKGRLPLSLLQETAKKGQARAEELFDVLGAINECNYALLAELGVTHEGRRLIEAIEQLDVKTLIRNHEWITALADELGGGGDPKASAAWHEMAKLWDLPPGVRPLVTLPEFKKEGQEMDHCVGGYYWQTRSHCFAVQASDGTRATLEVELRAPNWHAPRIVQLRSTSNSNPSPRCRALAQLVLTRNVTLMPKLLAVWRQHTSQEPTQANPGRPRRQRR